MTPTNSLLFTDTSRAALFDELVKIGQSADPAVEVKDEKGWKNALKHGLAGAAGVGTGVAAGVGVTEAADKFFKAKKPVFPRGSLPHKAVTIGLPIGMGLGATLWSRHRQKMHEKLHGKTPNDSR